MNFDRYYVKDGELPLDTIKPDGGLCAVFRTIGCIGDSLASGELESTSPDLEKRGFHDYFEYSWGQFMARAMGSKVYNFSRGGMTASEYMSKFAASRDFFNPEYACQCYVIALGVNDLLNRHDEIGSVKDIDPSNPDNNADTFAGWYGKVIQAYKKISPDAKFFLMSMPRRGDGKDDLHRAHRDLLTDMCKLFDNTYLIDLFEYAPVYDEKFHKHFYLGGHLSAQGYLITAEMVMSYIDYIMRKYPEDFVQAGFIGKGVHNYKHKW